MENCRELNHINDDFLEELYLLRRLTIESCDKLIIVPYGLRQLRSLVITQCQSLTHFLKDCLGYITQLKVLSIRGFSKELEAFPAGIINSIQHLSRSFEIPRIYGWDKLSVPRQPQHLAALEK